MANQFFDPTFRGAGSPGSPGVGSTRRGLATATQSEQQVQAGGFELQGARDKARLDSLIQGANQIKRIKDPAAKLAFAKNRKLELEASGLPSNDTDEVIDMLERGDLTALEEVTDQAIELGLERVTLSPGQRRFAGGREIASVPPTPARPSAAGVQFKDLTKDLSPEDQALARRIELGLSARAIGSAAQTIAEKGTAVKVAKSQSIIKEGEEFGKLTGSSRAKAIDNGFDTITAINKNILNIDRAIEQLDAGAKTGAIESRFFPSIRAASVALDQIQSELALDVVGATTFGALSAGELALARDVALPSKLDEPELRAFLIDKKTAQEKLRGYYQSQVDFIDAGGTVAGFLRTQERNQPSDQAVEAPAEEGQLPEGTIIKNSSTGQRMQVTNGQLVEI